MDWNLLNTVVLSYISQGHLYLWKGKLVTLHAVSDVFIALAYFSIFCTLGYFVLKRKDLPYPRVFPLFGVFIVSCGITHLLEIWTLWHPTYWLSGIAKAFTATVFLFTAIRLILIAPRAVVLKRPMQALISYINACRDDCEQAITDGNTQGVVKRFILPTRIAA